MIRSLLLDHVRDPHASWGCGRFGAIAEFHRDPDEPAEIVESESAVCVGTNRGALCLEMPSELRLVAYETIGTCIDSWGQGVALCLPHDTGRTSGRTIVSELGPDLEAVRPTDRAALLFDLGIGGEQAEICVRSADRDVIALLRSASGRPLFSHTPAFARDLQTLSPHRVFRCRLGRIEVYQPIPAPDGKTPDGPHTHVLPRLLALGRGHAATVPIPEGWIAGMTLHPAHPLLGASDEATAFDRARYEAFQALMDRYGDPALKAGKQAAFATGTRGAADDTNRRRQSLGYRIGLRQSRWLHAPD